MPNITIKSGQTVVYGQPMNIADVAAVVDELVAETDATIAAHRRKPKELKDVSDLDSTSIYQKWNRASSKADTEKKPRKAKAKSLDDLVAPAFARWNWAGGDHGQ